LRSVILENEQGVVPDTDKKKAKKGRKKLLESFFERFKKKKEKEIYEDFDTDEGENFDVTPEWLKNRMIIHDDLEDEIKPSKQLLVIPLYYGSSRKK